MDNEFIEYWEVVNHKLCCPDCAQFEPMKIVSISERIKDAMSIISNEIFQLKWLLN
jgi:hypothetical protein